MSLVLVPVPVPVPVQVPVLMQVVVVVIVVVAVVMEVAVVVAVVVVVAVLPPAARSKPHRQRHLTSRHRHAVGGVVDPAVAPSRTVAAAIPPWWH